MQGKVERGTAMKGKAGQSKARQSIGGQGGQGNEMRCLASQVIARQRMAWLGKAKALQGKKWRG
jgi:hypothetical protein